MFNADLPADSSKIRYSAGYIRANFQAIEAALGPGLTIFPPGTMTWFFQDSAPTGWTTVSTYGDAMIGIKGATGSLFAQGGNEYGTWQLPDHTLTIDEMPSHHHDAQQAAMSNQGNYVVRFDGPNRGSELKQFGTDVGGNQPHNHGNSWRPQTCVGIIASKN